METVRGRLRHRIPNLRVEDIIFSSSFMRFSVRQFLLLLVAAILALNVYALLSKVGLPSLWCWSGAAVPMLLGFLFGWVKVQGRALEIFLVSALRYWARPRLYVYRQRGETQYEYQAKEDNQDENDV